MNTHDDNSVDSHRDGNHELAPELDRDLAEDLAEDLDGELRRALDPDPATVRRLVSEALDERERPVLFRPFPGLGPDWAPSAALLVLLVLGLTVGILFHRVPPNANPSDSTDPSTLIDSIDPSTRIEGVLAEMASPPPPTATLKISNVGDVVTVSSAGGSHFIALPGDDS